MEKAQKSPAPLLKLTNLSFSYNERHYLFKSLNLSLYPGDFLCIVGPNGSGKTTLLRLILGLESPSSGKISRPAHLAYLPQESKIDPNFPATVEEVVLSGVLNRPGLHTFYKNSEKSEANLNLKRFNLDSFSEKPFSSLSGGQKQKVLLARALMSSAELLILDEPINNLDIKSQSELYAILKDLNREGLTIIMVTHDHAHGASLGNKLLTLPKD